MIQAEFPVSMTAVEAAYAEPFEYKNNADRMILKIFMKTPRKLILKLITSQHFNECAE